MHCEVQRAMSHGNETFINLDLTDHQPGWPMCTYQNCQNLSYSTGSLTWPVTFVHSVKPGRSKGKSSLLLANPVGSAPWVFRILLHRIKWICLLLLPFYEISLYNVYIYIYTVYHDVGGGLVMFGVPIRGLRQNRIAPFFKVGGNSLRKLK